MNPKVDAFGNGSCLWVVVHEWDCILLTKISNPHLTNFGPSFFLLAFSACEMLRKEPLARAFEVGAAPEADQEGEERVGSRHREGLWVEQIGLLGIRSLCTVVFFGVATRVLWF